MVLTPLVLYAGIPGHASPWVSDLVVPCTDAASSDIPPHLPPLVDLLVVHVAIRADADPLPSIVLDEILKVPQTGRELVHGLAPNICVRKNGPRQRGGRVRVWDRCWDACDLMAAGEMRREGAVRRDGVHGDQVARVLL